MAREIRSMDIRFSDAMQRYNAGSSVEGNIYLELQQELKFKSIKLQLLGISRVTWNEKKSYTKGSAPSNPHKNMSVCFDAVIMIQGSPGTLPPAKYNWIFKEHIPAYCPGSYDGQLGRVQYFAKFLIERGFGKSDIDLVKPLYVRGVLDLNHFEDAKGELRNEGRSYAGCLCCKSGPIEGSIYIPKKGYVPSETLPFMVDVKNYSKTKCTVKVILSEQAMFKAEDGQVRKSVQPLKGVGHKNPVRGRDKLHWEDQISAIPTVQPSHLGGGCKTIDVRYHLTLVVTPSGPGGDLSVPLEILLGTVPLRKAEPGAAMLTVKAAAARSPKDSEVVVKQRPSPPIQRAAIAKAADN